MYPTAEVRWFYQGTMPPAFLAWFQGFGYAPEEEPTRVDSYLRLVGTDSLSIKVREGRVEVKQRYEGCSIVQFHQRVAGRVGLWRKWSFGLVEAVSQDPHPETVGPQWVSVEKKRTLRRYRLDGKRVVAAAPGEVPDQGGDLELTRVRVGREEWWSVGLEAYGAEPVLESTLLLVAEYVMAPTQPPSLAAGNSYGYPEWLLHLEQEPGHLPASAPVPGR